MGALGRIVDLAVENPAGRAGASLALINPKAATGARFPVGAQTRSVAEDGRLRFAGGAGGLASLLGWVTGALDAIGIDGWLVLTQPAVHVGAPRGRNRATAGFIVSANSERLTLRSAHLANLGVAPGGHILLAPVPDRGALVIVDPCVCAALAPDRVIRLLGATDDHHVDGGTAATPPGSTPASALSIVPPFPHNTPGAAR